MSCPNCGAESFSDSGLCIDCLQELEEQDSERFLDDDEYRDHWPEWGGENV
jgi:hypothetical protein